MCKKYCDTYKYTLDNDFRFKEERSMGLLKKHYCNDPINYELN